MPSGNILYNSKKSKDIKKKKHPERIYCYKSCTKKNIKKICIGK